ncbi:MAG TPA: type II toxin-antitoxin system RelE/ParE family toxin [Pyrinomonadaceae bacterium]|jgi:mRNA interferase RelE/StbE|nr:type II toxin-antitoxin system RelE/ParE family toxin [Pyrinomonadaceae bacterium]
MAVYTIEFVKSARKEFERLPVKVRAKTVEALNLLAQNPYSELLKIKKMKGAADLYRIRLGDYRVLYELRNSRMVVLVIKIGHRSEVYRR